MAVLTLTVYDGMTKVKEYSYDPEFLTVGVCEDVFRLVDVDALLKADGDGASEVARNIVRAVMDFYPIAKRLFPELTEDEFRACLPRDVSALVMGIISYGLTQLAGASSGKKDQ